VLEWLHNLQITAAHTKFFPTCSVFTSPFLTMASISGNFWASALETFPTGHRLPTELSSESECESYITTDGQAASLSWNKVPILGLRPDFYYCLLQFRVCWYGAPSLTRKRICRLQLLLALASAVFLGPQSRGTRDHILLSQIRDLPFRRLLRLTGLRWMYSIPPPHGIELSSKSKSKLHCDWRSVNQ
jgi:hypothetical protein